ncbi:MAG: hypothetical protein KC619_08555 [Myxococcales bacterium]|nr:hypothetical protein [Myxococcales bacterium]
MDQLLAIVPSISFAALMVVGVIGYMIYAQKHRAQIQKDTADYQAGAMAQRLGMRIERGDPHQNLFVNTQLFETAKIDVALRGERHGVPIEIVYLKETWTETGIVSSTIHRKWEGRLTARTPAQFGHFEVSLRQPQSYNVVRSYFAHPMPELPTGDPRTDSLLRVTGDNPPIAGALGPLLAPLTRLNYVHVIGRPGEVTFLMSHCAGGRGLEMMGVGYALHDAELIFDVLTRIALTAEGRA